MNQLKHFPGQRLLTIGISLFVIIGSPSTCSAEVYSQIAPVPFFEPAAGGATYAVSQFDSATDPGDLSDFATVYDNFQLNVHSTITSFGWLGIYRDLPGVANLEGQTAPLADSFTVRVFNDPLPGVGATIGSEVASFANVSANETEVAPNTGIYSYSLDVTPFSVTLGQDYWFSVVANMDADTPFGNEWGLAFSPLGDDLAVQDFQTAPSTLTRFTDPVDYQFSVTSVPEPGSAVVLALAGGFAAIRLRSRQRAKSNLA